tara:strand:+ start:102 stop:530 length:429 start_codon:yes stop_codon:yes gene_type:complete
MDADKQTICKYVNAKIDEWRANQSPEATIADFCNRSGISGTQLAQLRNGERLGRTPGKRFCDFFGVSSVELMTGGESNNLSQTQLDQMMMVMLAIEIYADQVEPLTIGERTRMIGQAVRTNSLDADSLENLFGLQPHTLPRP